MGNKETEFSLEELDRMYEEAMKWEPPVTQVSQVNQTDPKATLQKLIASRKNKTEVNK